MIRREFLGSATSAMALSTLRRDPGFAKGRAQSPAAPKRRIFLNDDDNGFMLSHRGPMRPEMVTDSIEAIVGTPVTTYVLCVSYSDVLIYPSKVEEMYGWRETPGMRSPGFFHHVYEFYQEVRRRGWDIPKMAMSYAAQKGIEFIPSMRMNDAHFAEKVNPRENPITGRFWMEHQDLIINPNAKWPAPYQEWVLDFSHEAVRDYRMRIAREVIERYGAAGVEMDWTRHYKFFPTGHEQPELITDMVRKVRTALDHRATGRRRPILICRVAASINGNLSIGLDVKNWVRERLVDFLVICPPNRYMPFDLPVAEWMELVKGSGIQVHCDPDSAAPRGDGVATLDMYRAVGSNYYNLGADGIYFFNFIIRGAPNIWPDDSYIILRDLADPENLRRRNKLFMATLDNWRKDTDTLPVLLTGPDRVARIGLMVGDDLPAARRSCSLEHVLLRLRVGECTSDDRFEVMLNGQHLDSTRIWIPNLREWAEWKQSIASWTYEAQQLKGPWGWIEAELGEGMPRQGDNVVTIRQLSRAVSDPRPTLKLTDVDLKVEYDYFGHQCGDRFMK
jgi:hypothetical protein